VDWRARCPILSYIFAAEIREHHGHDHPGIDGYGGGTGWSVTITVSMKTELKTNRVTRKMINDKLRERGRDESLRDGGGYFYFGGGEAVNWLTNSVRVRQLSDLTLEQWLEEFDKLLKIDKKLHKRK
jgi:hypothetical protein